MRYGSYKVMRVGSCATRSREPSQVRKEAALSGPSRVPQGCLTRAEDEYDLMAPVSTAGARSPHIIRSLTASRDTRLAAVRSLARVSLAPSRLATLVRAGSLRSARAPRVVTGVGSLRLRGVRRTAKLALTIALMLVVPTVVGHRGATARDRRFDGCGCSSRTTTA